MAVTAVLLMIDTMNDYYDRPSSVVDKLDCSTTYYYTSKWFSRFVTRGKT